MSPRAALRLLLGVTCAVRSLAGRRGLEARPGGAISRLSLLAATPGLADSPSSVCEALGRAVPGGLSASLRRAAVVGNGPLSQTQREEINSADLVIRFNKLNNWFCGDRLDLWVSRYALEAPYFYHGIRQLKGCRTEQALAQARALFLLDSLDPGALDPLDYRDEGVADLLADFPRARDLPRLRFNSTLLTQHYGALVEAGDPSSGWVGTVLALACTPPSTVIDLYGFNWSRANWNAHRIGAEERFARALRTALGGRLRLQPPPCGGFRDCGGCTVADTAAAAAAPPAGPPGAKSPPGGSRTPQGGGGGGAGAHAGCGPGLKPGEVTDVSLLPDTVAKVNARRHDRVFMNATTMVIEHSLLTDLDIQRKWDWVQQLAIAASH